MSKVFDMIMDGLDQAVTFAEGKARPDSYLLHLPEQVDVKAIRRRYRMTQEQFARKFGFSKGRIRDWEQGRTSIDAPSRVLLTIIDKEPEAVERALSDI